MPVIQAPSRRTTTDGSSSHAGRSKLLDAVPTPGMLPSGVLLAGWSVSGGSPSDGMAGGIGVRRLGAPRSGARPGCAESSTAPGGETVFRDRDVDDSGFAGCDSGAAGCDSGAAGRDSGFAGCTAGAVSGGGEVVAELPNRLVQRVVLLPSALVRATLRIASSLATLQRAQSPLPLARLVGPPSEAAST